MLLVATFATAERSDAETAGYYTSETRTLSQAFDLAGPLVAALPILLARTRPAGASPGVEAWTSYGEDGRPQHIFVYTQSQAFRCANRHPTPAWQCRLKLASIIVHEAVHFGGSRDEKKAYEAQIAFLIGNRAASEMIASVIRARDVATARQRQWMVTRTAESVRSGQALELAEPVLHVNETSGSGTERLGPR
jgi:hypothetical protein